SSTIFLLISPRHPRSTLFPYTTLFRSKVCIPFKKGINFFEIRKAFLGINFGVGITSLENDANKKQKGKRLHGFGLAMKFKLFIRSEEHTSELQSRENLVCRLLLEKKNI